MKKTNLLLSTPDVSCYHTTINEKDQFIAIYPWCVMLSYKYKWKRPIYFNLPLMYHAIIQLLMIKTNSFQSTPDVSCYHTNINEKDQFNSIYPWCVMLSYKYKWKRPIYFNLPLMYHAIIQLLMIKTNLLLSTPDVSCYHTTINEKDQFIAIYPWCVMLSYKYKWKRPIYFNLPLMYHAIIQLLMIKTNSFLSTPDVSCYHTTINDKDQFISIYPWCVMLSYNY